MSRDVWSDPVHASWSKPGTQAWKVGWLEFDVRGVVSYTVSWKAAPNTAGSLWLVVCNDPSRQGRNQVPVLVQWLGPTGSLVGPTDQAGSTAVTFHHGFRFVRLEYTWAAGGAPGQFEVHAYARQSQ